MKTLLGLMAIVFCFSFSHVPSSNPPADEATIYIYRGGQFAGSARNWSIFVDDEKVCKLSNNKFIKVTVKPGKRVINSKIGGVEVLKKETGLEVDVEAGKEYYVSCTVKQSFTRFRLELTEVTKSTANKQMKDMAMDKCQDMNDD